MSTQTYRYEHFSVLLFNLVFAAITYHYKYPRWCTFFLFNTIISVWSLVTGYVIDDVLTKDWVNFIFAVIVLILIFAKRVWLLLPTTKTVDVVKKTDRVGAVVEIKKVKDSKKKGEKGKKGKKGKK